MPQVKTWPTQERIKEHGGNKGKRLGQFQNTYGSKGFMHLFRFYYVTASEVCCLAELAKLYHVSEPTCLFWITNVFHCTQNKAHPMMILVYIAILLSVFILKPCPFVYETMQHFSIFVFSSRLAEKSTTKLSGAKPRIGNDELQFERDQERGQNNQFLSIFSMI